MFYYEFCEIFKNIFYRTPPEDSLCIKQKNEKQYERENKLSTEASL